MQNDKQLRVAFLDQDHPLHIGSASLILDKIEKHRLSCRPWAAYPYQPIVAFSIAHTRGACLLKFYVEEKFVKASCGRINEPVYKDSCVEFFLSLDEKEYYNLEFNCLGTALVGYGKDKDNRKFLPEEVIKKIDYQVYINNAQENIRWELTLVIPVTIFIYDDVVSLSGYSTRGNFYKCGDDLPEPHFLSWTEIDSTEPNFHLPQFFGTLLFE